MDPLLSAILQSRDPAALLQDTKPGWVQGADRVGGYQSVQAPTPRRFAAPTAEAAQENLRQGVLEEWGQYSPKSYAEALFKHLVDMLSRKAPSKDTKLAASPEALERALDVWNPSGTMVAGVLGGKKAAETLGGKTLEKFLGGEAATAAGGKAQEVWRSHGYERGAEGAGRFEFPQASSSEDLLAQLAKAYPELNAKVLSEVAPERSGYFHGPSKTIMARGPDEGVRREVLEHEAQHAADFMEGHASGGSYRDPQYKSLAGEVSARNAEARLRDPELREFAPSLTEDSDIPRLMQIIKQDPSAVMEAVKEPGGMWHPEAVERLSEPLYSKLATGDLAQFSRAELRMGEGMNEPLYKQNKAAADWSDRAIRNYLNKYAGTERDPLKDVEIPFGERTSRWEDIMDQALGRSTMPKPPGAKPDETIWAVRQGPEQGHYEDGIHQPDSATAIKSYLSHVGDYLRQNVSPEKLQQYDLVRAVKETAANDARVAKEMEKAAAASMKDMPIHKDYGDGFKWVELKLPEKLTEEQRKLVKDMGGVRIAGSDHQYAAVDSKGNPVKSSYSQEIATGSTPEEAHLAGQLAQEGNQMGHCVGGYCEGVASGESRIFSLRDAKGKSHVTVEVAPNHEIVANMALSQREMRERGIAPTKEPVFNILQIKGKQNRAPSAEYLPYVQDFVKSGKWGEVGDLGNARLIPDGKGGYRELAPDEPAYRGR